MKAAAVDRFGPPSALKLHEVPVPKPRPHEVLIAIHTAGIGSWDTSIRDGSWRRLAGGQALERCLDFVQPRGRVVHPNGIEPEPVARRTLRIRSFDAVASPREFAKLQRRIDAGKIRVPITAVYPLARAADAHRHLDRGHVLGRMAFGVRR